MSLLYISSTSTDDNTGSGRLVIEGQLTVPNECDDPIVELFRPIRATQKDKMFFVVYTNRQEHSITCTLYPSNHKNRPEEVFIKDALGCLKGESGILANYKTILELFFTEKTGLELWKKALEKKDYNKCNEIIKKFVIDVGLTMPSRKKLPKPKKTKAQKRADGKEYQKKHPEIKTTKKPAE